LLFKIQQLGIDGPLLNLLSSYLSQHSQVVLINKNLSDLKYTSCIVPQGSILGPLLFLIYVNNIAKNINASISLFKIFPRYATGQKFGILTSILLKLLL